jgi:hypothetical protein
MFPRLFPHPTNNNGYEEWVLAADLIQGDAKVEAMLANPNLTLSWKRRALDDPAVIQALQFVHAGVNKPVFSPRATMDENTLLPELGAFRQLARLLATEQYVAFADGRVDSAISSLRIGLAFGYRIQTDSLISGLVGVAVDSIVLKEFSQHVDQLSVFQCNEVRRIVEDFLAAENPAVHVFTVEKSNMLQILASKRSDPEALLSLLKPLGDAEEANADPDMATIQNYVKTHPAEVNALLDDAGARISALYDQTILNLRLPLAQRKPVMVDQDNSPGAALFRAVTVNPQQVVDKYTRDQTQLRLLGVHVLIHRYRWDHNALPAGLADLHAPGIIKDPLTGAEILYQRDGDRYTLTSHDPTQRSAAGP